MDFSPWLNFDDTPVEPMEIEVIEPVGGSEATAFAFEKETTSNPCGLCLPFRVWEVDFPTNHGLI